MSLHQSGEQANIHIQFAGVSEGHVSALRGKVADVLKVKLYEVDSADGSMHFAGDGSSVSSALSGAFKDDSNIRVQRQSGGTDGSAIFCIGQPV